MRLYLRCLRKALDFWLREGYNLDLYTFDRGGTRYERYINAQVLSSPQAVKQLFARKGNEAS